MSGLPPLSMYNPDGDADRREIWIIKRPAEHRSLLVVAGRHGVSCLSRMTRGVSTN